MFKPHALPVILIFPITCFFLFAKGYKDVEPPAGSDGVVDVESPIFDSVNEVPQSEGSDMIPYSEQYLEGYYPQLSEDELIEPDESHEDTYDHTAYLDALEQGKAEWHLENKLEKPLLRRSSPVTDPGTFEGLGFGETDAEVWILDLDHAWIEKLQVGNVFSLPNIGEIEGVNMKVTRAERSNDPNTASIISGFRSDGAAEHAFHFVISNNNGKTAMFGHYSNDNGKYLVRQHDQTAYLIKPKSNPPNQESALGDE